MASGVYNRAKFNLMSGRLDLNGSGSHIINAALTTSSYTFNADDAFWTNISTLYEVSGTNYVANGTALTNKLVTQDNSADLAWFDADDVTWATSTITARYCILYDATLTTKDVVAAFDFGSDQSSSAGNFTISWNVNGIFKIT